MKVPLCADDEERYCLACIPKELSPQIMDNVLYIQWPICIPSTTLCFTSKRDNALTIGMMRNKGYLCLDAILSNLWNTQKNKNHNSSVYFSAAEGLDACDGLHGIGVTALSYTSPFRPPLQIKKRPTTCVRPSQVMFSTPKEKTSDRSILSKRKRIESDINLSTPKKVKC